MPTVFANNRSIVHKGDGGTNTAAPPDVCKTPTPGGPVPIPYVNVAMTSDLTSGTTTVEIEGNSVGLKSSNLVTSTGDEAGNAGGGIMSNMFKGKMTWISSSLDVKFEGTEVVRFMDVTMHNGNQGNTAHTEFGGTYGADFTGPCDICKKSWPDHPKTKDDDERPTARHAEDLVHKLHDDSTVPKTDRIRALEEQKATLRAEEDAAKSAVSKTTDKGEQTRLIKASRALAEEASKLNTEIKTLNTELRTSSVTRPGGEGYMVGVMMCETHPKEKKFAAMSGQKTLPGFRRVAEKAGFTLAAKSGPVSQEDYKRKNPRIAGATLVDFEKAWADAALDAHTTNSPSPGVCAAQRLLAEPGHQPVAMTEMLFGPKADQQVTMRHIRDANGFAEALKAKLDVTWTAVRTRTFEDRDVVPSCRTCQVLLPFLLCDKKPQC